MKRLAALLLVAAAAYALMPRREQGLRVATFNIRGFGRENTDEDRLVEILDGLGADVLAVQEIQDPERFARVVGRMRGRRAVALSRCGGRSDMRVGFVWDAERVAFAGSDEFPELAPDRDGGCRLGQRPGLLGYFRAGNSSFELLVVHLAARGDPEMAALRRRQWERAFAIAATRRAPLAILGDTNSTGFLDDKYGERSFLRERAARAGMRIVTEGLPCSEYFSVGNTLQPSMLDHVVVTPDFPARGGAHVGGYCVETACRPLDARDVPWDHVTVSDHCPVSVGGW